MRVRERQPEQASEAIARAFHTAETGTPGPVAVILPEDIFDEETDAELNQPRPRVVAGRLHAVVGELRLPHEASDVSDVVTVSVGVVMASGDELPEPDELIRRADAALYDAKRAGRNRTSYYEG